MTRQYDRRGRVCCTYCDQYALYQDGKADDDSAIHSDNLACSGHTFRLTEARAMSQFTISAEMAAQMREMLGTPETAEESEEEE